MFHFVLEIYFLMLALSGLWYLINKPQIFLTDTLAILPLVLVPGLIYLALSRRRMSIHSNGLARRGLLGTREIHDQDVDGISLKRFQEEVNGVNTGTVHRLTVQSRSGTCIRYYGHLSNSDSTLLEYAHRVALIISEAWLAKLEGSERINLNQKFSLSPANLIVSTAL